MSIIEIEKELGMHEEGEGLQIVKNNGLLHSTWLLYKRKESYFIFDPSDKIEFKEGRGFSKMELFEEFRHAKFEIDMVIG